MCLKNKFPNLDWLTVRLQFRERVQRRGSRGLQWWSGGLAIANFVLGLLGLCGIGSLIAIIFGHCALSETDKSHGKVAGQGLAIAGIVHRYVLGVIVLLCFWLSLPGRHRLVTQ